MSLPGAHVIPSVAAFPATAWLLSGHPYSWASLARACVRACVRACACVRAPACVHVRLRA
eukprot:3895748-Amphidinium_carterae.2